MARREPAGARPGWRRVLDWVLAGLLGSALAALVVGLFGGCAAALDNVPLNRPAADGSAPLVAPHPPQPADRQVIGMSLSGGGLRAAAFSLGVMRELAAAPQDVYADVRFISSVSGGSLTAAYLGLQGRPGLDSAREDLLLRDYELHLRLSPWSPANLLRLLAGGMNDRSNLGQVLDRDVFRGADFDTLWARSGPEVWINATDLYNRTPFPFVPEVFAALCSDLGSLRVSEAVAASMAVPLAFAPVVLRSWGERCSDDLPAWTALEPTDGGASADLLASTARAVSNYRNPGRMRYVKLADGGLTDNQGLSSILVARAVADKPYAPLSEADAVTLRRMLFLVVDAGRPPSGDWAMTPEGPSAVDIGLAAADAAVDSATRLSLQVFRREMARWREQLVAYRCALPTERVRALRGAESPWDCADLVVEVDVLGFEGLPPELAARMREMPTRLKLSAADADTAIAAGAWAARRSAALARYRAQREAQR